MVFADWRKWLNKAFGARKNTNRRHRRREGFKPACLLLEERLAPAASMLEFTTTAQTLTAGIVSDVITVQEEDPFGNVTNAAEMVNLSTSNTATGLFKDNAMGLTTITVGGHRGGQQHGQFQVRGYPGEHPHPHRRRHRFDIGHPGRDGQRLDGRGDRQR